MEIYNNYQNKDDVLFRNIIIGTLHALDDRIFWNNTIDNVKTKVEVPSYFTIAGSERFLSDIFLNSDELKKDGKSTGLYNKYPRAILNLQNIVMQEEYLTNKFKRANFIKQESKTEIREYNSEFIEAPFKLSFDVTIMVDSIIDIFKCIQNIFDNLYKNVNYYVDVFSVKVPCYFSIPFDINKERLINFGLSEKKEIQISFPIEVEASYPIFKKESEIFAGDRMENVISNYYLVFDKPSQKNSSGRTLQVEKDVWPSGNNETNFHND